MEFGFASRRKWIAPILCLVFAAGFLLFYEKEDPAKWAIGKWKDTQYGVTAEISPEKVRVISMDGRRKYTFTYTIDTSEPPYEVSFYRGGNLYGTALVTFDGRDKALVKRNPGQNDSDLEEAANNYTSVWLRDKEGD